MDPARWRRLEELFEAARSLPADRRSAFLEDAEDEGLRAEVEGMLAAEEHAETLIGGLVDAAVARGPDGEKMEPHGSDEFYGGAESFGGAEPRGPARIGPYRILREVGQGGMSTVYLAERADEHYRQRVAVKVVRRGPGSRDMLLHLRRERQILAGLDHPNLAKLLDGGNTEDGLPYFVMDYVPGEPVDVFCVSEGLTVRRRVELFLQICSAAQYAHANLVIHRDIKPGNILVGEGGVPKLLDFGIAKLLEPEDSESARLATDLATPTSPGLRLLTPEYASPEQVRGEALTVATDVYSLGVLLYELLAGRRPYELDRRRPAELERTVCEHMPPPPSEALASEDETPRPYKGSRERWRRRVAGDLDNITLMALRKEPERRYASVEQLAEDVRRHLDGRPVRARSDTWSYRFGKFLRRHRRPVAATAAVLTLVVTLVTFYTQQLAEERDRALREEKESAQVAGLLVDVFGAADPEQAQGEELTAREILDLGATRVRAELADQPLLRADLLEHVAAIYLRLGLYRRAGPLLDEIESLRRSFLGDEHVKVADVLHLRGRWLQALDRFEEAEQAHHQGLELRRAARPTDHSGAAVAGSLTDLANLHHAQGRFQEAVALFAEALELRRLSLAADDPAIATSLNDLALALARTDRRAEAGPLMQEAFDRRLAYFGDRHPVVAESAGNLGTVLAAVGAEEAAKVAYEKALEMRRDLYGADHPLVARSSSNLGHHLRVLGDYAAAEPLLREAVQIYRLRSGVHRERLRRALGNLAEVLRLRGRPEEAERAYRESLKITLDVLGEDDASVSTLLWKIGDCLLARGELVEAEGTYREVLSRRLARFPESHRRVASSRAFLARALLLQNRAAEAESLLGQALPVLLDALPKHWLTAEALILRAEARLQLSGDVQPSREWISKSLEILALLPKRPASTADMRRRLEARARELQAQGLEVRENQAFEPAD